MVRFAHVHLVSCPACTHLPVRNGLVNNVKFLEAYSPKVVRTNKIARLVTTSLIAVKFLFPLDYPYLF